MDNLACQCTLSFFHLYRMLSFLFPDNHTRKYTNKKKSVPKKAIKRSSLSIFSSTGNNIAEIRTFTIPNPKIAHIVSESIFSEMLRIKAPTISPILKFLYASTKIPDGGLKSIDKEVSECF